MIPKPILIRLRRAAMYLIEGVSLISYCVVYFLTIIVFSLCYILMSPGPNGLIVSGTTTAVTGFWPTLYFSVSTITTVCYGDIVPIGFSRFCACLEALIGLGLMGIMLTKLTSGRISYHVLRLFGSYAENRLDQFRSCFQNIKTELEQLSPDIVKAFPETPDAVAAPASRAEFLKSFSNGIELLHFDSNKFCKYLKDELDEGFFLTDAPTTSLVSAGESVHGAVFVLTQILLALGPQARIVVLDRINLKRINEVLHTWHEVGGEIKKRAKNEELRKCFIGITEVCSGLAEGFFSVPLAVKETGQPDQTLKAAGGGSL